MIIAQSYIASEFGPGTEISTYKNLSQLKSFLQEKEWYLYSIFKEQNKLTSF